MGKMLADKVPAGSTYIREHKRAVFLRTHLRDPQNTEVGQSNKTVKQTAT